MSPGEPIPKAVCRALVAIFIALHVAIGFWYGSVTPYRTGGIVLSQRGAPAPDIGSPDERQHANYVAGLLEGRGFPVFRPLGPEAIEHIEDHQPPLYYTMAAGYARLVGLSADSIRSTEGRSLRWLNLLFGAAGVVGAFALGERGFGRRDVGLIAAAFYALLPMNLALSGAVNNDPLLIALGVWILALAAQGVREGWSVRAGAALGVLMALAALTKTSALALLPVLAAGALMRRPGRAPLLATLVPAIVVPLPWWLRNWTLYGDPFALRAFKAAFGGTAQASGFIEGFGVVGYLVNWVLWWTARSFIGAFGYMDVWLNETGLPSSPVPNALYRVLLALLFAAFLGWVVRFREAEPEERKVHLLATMLAAIVIVQMLAFNLQYFQAQARYLFPALGAFCSGVAWGTLRLSRGRWKLALLLVAVPLLGTALYAGSILPAEFARRTGQAAP